MCQHCDDLLKASRPGDDPWRPHESPFIRQLIESWTNKGLDKFGALQAELVKWIDLKGHAGHVINRSPGTIYRWTPGELGAAKHYLENAPAELFTLDDWMMVVDYLIQRYLPQDVMTQEAEWLAVRSNIMGQVQAKLGALTLGQAASLLAAAPFKIETAQAVFGGMAAPQQAVMEFGKARCCQYVTNATESLRGKLKTSIIDWQEQKYLGTPDKQGRTSLQQKLLDDFGDLNRDWRRIALTEAGENANQGLVASCAPGEQLKRHERYTGACAFCTSINGKVFTVVSPDSPDKNWDTQVWAGKSNHGRSSSPSKRTPDGLVKRTDAEMWKPAAGVFHPHCRGMWERLAPSKTNEPGLFDAWLRQNLKKG